MSADATPPLDRRRAVFAAIIEIHQRGTQLGRVRALVAQMFGLTEAQVTAIEREGVLGDWSPIRLHPRPARGPDPGPE